MVTEAGVTMTPISQIRPHPLADIVPPMRHGEWNDFYADVSMAGIRVPIEIYADGTILDGHHRYKAALALGMTEVPTRPAPLNGDRPDVYMLKAAVLRRHLTDDQRATLAAKWAGMNHREPGRPVKEERSLLKNNAAPRGAAFTVSNPDQSPTRATAIHTFNVGRRDFDKANKVMHADPELFERVHKGEIALNNAARTVKMREQRAAIEHTKPIDGTFQVIVIDPPWPYNERQDDPTHRISSPYQAIPIAELALLTIPSCDDAILWLWATNAFLHDAFHLMERWGFQYRTMLTWAKQGPGLGDWLAGQTEHCLVGNKGSYRVFRDRESTLLVAPRTAHSEKPEAFYEMVERLCPGTKVDMFARKQRNSNWASWGAESGC